jgi:methylenetetrahydrofolate reductase (NADPH)
VIAVTWGVFKGKEVVQPTVVDHQAFVIWKDEAFNAWVNTWALIYKGKKNKEGVEEGVDQESIDFLTKCYNDMWLINIVDNDYIEGDLNKVISDFIDANTDLIASV